MTVGAFSHAGQPQEICTKQSAFRQAWRRPSRHTQGDQHMPAAWLHGALWAAWTITYLDDEDDPRM
jgi:hypothetical protein